jgi:hypothetical protein
VVGDPAAEETRRVLRAVRGMFRPNSVVAFKPAAGADPRLDAVVPLLAGKEASGGAVTTFVCRDFACQAPLVGADAAEGALRTPAPPAG